MRKWIVIGSIVSLCIVVLTSVPLLHNLVLSLRKGGGISAVEYAPEGPKIVGNRDFQYAVGLALDKLRDESPSAFGVTTKYLHQIVEGSYTATWADRTPTRMELTSVTANLSTTWCAGVIAHEAMHCKLYRDYLEEHGLPVPNDVWASEDAERKCNAFQLETLARIGAPSAELEHMKNQDGTHGDLNGDGVSNLEDRHIQNW